MRLLGADERLAGQRKMGWIQHELRGLAALPASRPLRVCLALSRAQEAASALSAL